MNLHPLTAQDVAPGSPLPWPLFDEDGHLLFERGETLAAGYPLETLYRDTDNGAAAEPTPVAEFSATERFEELPASEMFPPNGIKPQMWEVVQLRRLGREGQAHYFSRLVGYIKDVSILTTVPRTPRQPVPVAEGEQVEVRMLTGSNIYVFRSEIIKISLVPYSYMHLSFPDKVQRQHLRKSPWAKVNLAVKADCGAASPFEGLIVNLSASGARVDSTVILGKEGLSVTLHFLIDLDGMKREMNLPARIMHVRPAAKNPGDGASMVEHGVAFQSVAELDELWLRCLVYQRIAEGFLI